MNSPNDTPATLAWPTEAETIPENLKERINNFLWVVLPPWTTIGVAENIACTLDRNIRGEWATADSLGKTKADE